jgi:hypothetical protein
MSIRIPCNYCPAGHKYVCNCGRSHSDHLLGGGCISTKCDGYSQTLQRLPTETTKDFNYRVLHPVKKRRKA